MARDPGGLAGRLVQAGLTISAGVTPAFWIYCAFVVALAVACARILISPRSAALSAGPSGASPVS